MKEIIIVGIIFFVIAVTIEYFVKRKFNIDRKRTPLSKPIKRLQFILLTICFISYLVISFAIIIKYGDFNLGFVVLPFFIVISFIRGFIQWKYNRKANVWIQEIFSAISFTIFCITIGLLVYY